MQSQTGAESEKCTASTAWLEHWEEYSPVNTRKSNQYSKIWSTGTQFLYNKLLCPSLSILIQQTAVSKSLTIPGIYPLPHV